MPTLDPERFPPRPAGPAGGGSTLGDFTHPGGPCASSDCPNRAPAAPCPECWGFIGHRPSCPSADFDARYEARWGPVRNAGYPESPEGMAAFLASAMPLSGREP